jgi:YHS domain-containing protein
MARNFSAGPAIEWKLQLQEREYRMKITTKSLWAVLSVLVLTAAVSFAQTEPAVYKTKDNLALSGYDAVSYFRDGKPVAGKPAFSYKWMDATWRFSSAENRNAFAKEPEKYAPQYGGYCAFGTSQGHLVPGDPQAWKIVDNKLYLNYNKDVQKYWLQDILGFIEKADENWPKMHQ